MAKKYNVLTEKQQKFAELVARDMDAHEAYKEVYNYNTNNKNMLDSKTRLLLNNSKIVAEIERIQKFETEGKYNLSVDKEEALARMSEFREKKKKDDEKWTQELVFSKLKDFLDKNDEALTILKERPMIFATIKKMIEKVSTKLSGVHIDDEKWKKDLLDCFETIEDCVERIGDFNIKEYNSTVNTGIALMKEINAVTGVTKNVSEMKKRSFEDRLLDIIGSNINNNNIKELEDYAFSENN